MWKNPNNFYMPNEFLVNFGYFDMLAGCYLRHKSVWVCNFFIVRSFSETIFLFCVNLWNIWIFENLPHFYGFSWNWYVISSQCHQNVYFCFHLCYRSLRCAAENLETFHKCIWNFFININKLVLEKILWYPYWVWFFILVQEREKCSIF